ncbi:TPA: 2Fe-2S iron-sulfur cluster binding domain-containing protein [Pseudomonas aeruginosa]|jgi:ferredoxin|uniref:Ferredoxin n=2 Tax=Pseudomonas putida TaxID=303 RepID=D5MPG5_PSEPU|nr:MULTISPECIES: 2Fe-2S iron-sulfur cluster binding domain-containing protein [Pseudomonas]ENY77171.1 ferredoxin [Pseudomonas putida TRO1]MDP5445050.1 2Fe-2S iron-sulfur cluster binding domain-containing protein [Pseudomonas aeruginosa]MDY7555264.1 2Fe-2S iron-sulfur cluster binding domain-containing protein [Pseudomonas sp. FG1]MEB0054421.1 2Fe-2S iron-sulfur cluster binding domain-containing protein [Pseudomonas sp. FG1]OPA56326.1 ferredoxin [Pseudomonas aeruginosa]
MDSSYEVRERISGQVFRCLPEQSVLRAMEEQGKRCVPVGCRGGGCGLCKVRVLSGDYQCGRMSCSQVPPEAAKQGLALACQLYPRADLYIECLRQVRSNP